MDVFLFAVAFFFGLLAQQFGLPPLVGFLISGFVLHALGQRGGQTLDTISNLGVAHAFYYWPKASFARSAEA
jgi:predicted Kef-type K+ transport protein